MSEATELIKELITKVERDREVAVMAKTRVERDVRDQQAIVDLHEASLRSLRSDLSTLEQSGSQAGEQ